MASLSPTYSHSVLAPIPPDLTQAELDSLLAEVGLNRDEYRLFVQRLGRQPNKVELGMAGAMWSEHCGYKHSKPLLRRFPTKGPRVLQGPGENAGIVDLGDGWAAALKVESHNHPSAVEPVEGAATGVGGIVRDIFTMGARPVALLNSLRFGPLSEPRNRYLFGGVVAGIGGYGNCIGVPTVGGEIYFDPSYSGNPLVNAMCVGLLRSDQVMRATASGVGNPVLLVGADTGRDGIHGATFASDTLGEDALQDRPAVQVGNPFLEKCLMEACLEVLQLGIVVGMQDLGAAGLTSSSVECAARGGAGIEIDLAHVARREHGMNAYEIMLSESQERMLVIVEKGREAEAQVIFTRWGLHSDVIGRVTDDGMVRIYDGEALAAKLPARLLADEVPIRYVAGSPDSALAGLQDPDWDAILQPEQPGTRYDRALLDVLSSPNVASKERVYRTYDHTIGTNTVLQPGEADAAVLRVKGTSKGIALTVDCNSRYCYLDPYQGGVHAVAEAARNLSCVGAEPLAVTDCLNFGNPERPEVFYQMESAVSGMSDACNALDVPVVSGNVSLYNETNGVAVLPTPVVGMIGLLDDVERRASMALRDGLVIGLLCGTTDDRRPTTDEASLGASQYLETCYGLKVGAPPPVDLDAERAVQAACREAIRRGVVDVAHDCSDGGLIVALAEMCIAGKVGAGINISGRHYAEHLREIETLFAQGNHDGALERVMGMMRDYAEASTTHMASLQSSTWTGTESSAIRGSGLLVPESALLKYGSRIDAALFGEMPSRIIVAFPHERWNEIDEIARSNGASLLYLGMAGGDYMGVTLNDRASSHIINLTVSELVGAWRGGLQAASVQQPVVPAS